MPRPRQPWRDGSERRRTREVAEGWVAWKTPMPIRINYDGAFFSRSRLQGQRWTPMRNQRIVQLDTATGAIVYDQTWDLPFGEQGAQTYDALTDSLIAYTSAGWVRRSLGRGAGQAAALGDIVAQRPCPVFSRAGHGGSVAAGFRRSPGGFAQP